MPLRRTTAFSDLPGPAAGEAMSPGSTLGTARTDLKQDAAFIICEKEKRKPIEMDTKHLLLACFTVEYGWDCLCCTRARRTVTVISPSILAFCGRVPWEESRILATQERIRILSSCIQCH
ncbi:hypothetical protein PsYK624_146260 [Phanerochaete sordida]|uniref:Uncharacterized protein n=1 Tax=Phanerochaete sordida TaxID=48140 RepID=A0A9P3LLK1_9APHY|nr:hypothetical protein PsYK624_146260 [Phanerochaete sordida]